VYGLERLAAACSDAELVQNPEDIEVLRRLRIPRQRIHLLGNGVDLARFDRARVDPAAVEERRREVGAGPDDVLVGAVGRMVVEKGYRELFDAAARLARPGVRFAVIGPDEPDKADALGPADHQLADEAGVVRLGERKDMAEWYAAFDVFVLPSWREGFPRAAMEAAAMGLPIVTTDVRGCRQVVDDGTTGLLVPVRDPARLAGAIGRLVDDADLRRRFGAAASAKAQAEFDQQRQIDLTLGVYDELLDRARRRGHDVPVRQPA
jgi:glycosyltransferase involved in cell wall biosynthesis